ncbi:MAG: hypothetical protein ACRCXB_28050 [Aeromonadaceae bacterium]
MEKMRKEFEAWIDSETGFDCFRTNYPMTKPEDQQYMCHRTNLAWLSWQASRSALCVELPENCKGMALTVDEFRSQLDKAGVRYE